MRGSGAFPSSDAMRRPQRECDINCYVRSTGGNCIEVRGSISDPFNRILTLSGTRTTKPIGYASIVRDAHVRQTFPRGVVGVSGMRQHGLQELTPVTYAYLA